MLELIYGQLVHASTKLPLEILSMNGKTRGIIDNCSKKQLARSLKSQFYSLSRICNLWNEAIIGQMQIHLYSCVLVDTKIFLFM